MRNISVFGCNHICKWDAESRVTSPSGLSQPIFIISHGTSYLYFSYTVRTLWINNVGTMRFY